MDPESCQVRGYIMCESDSILDSIPDLSYNKLCTQGLKLGHRFKREMSDLFLQASDPTYDLSKIVKTTLNQNRNLNEDNHKLLELQRELDSMITQAKEESDRSTFLLREAEKTSLLIKIIFIIGIPILAWITY